MIETFELTETAAPAEADRHLLPHLFGHPSAPRSTRCTRSTAGRWRSRPVPGIRFRVHPQGARTSTRMVIARDGSGAWIVRGDGRTAHPARSRRRSGRRTSAKSVGVAGHADGAGRPLHPPRRRQRRACASTQRCCALPYLARGQRAGSARGSAAPGGCDSPLKGDVPLEFALGRSRGCTRARRRPSAGCRSRSARTSAATASPMLLQRSRLAAASLERPRLVQPWLLLTLGGLTVIVAGGDLSLPGAGGAGGRHPARRPPDHQPTCATCCAPTRTIRSCAFPWRGNRSSAATRRAARRTLAP
ncbi:MAG: hypothetical protein MZV65_43855 [Chromatiales bacterium]|nr:hypothetical protein [Chromatiales bacterium]